jgi:NAD(P)-dependent dehydrogenase (short-subunit alcohol dehydrogenase family)
MGHDGASVEGEEPVQDLESKVAVVTGGGSGIGRALAQRFAAEGMRVVVADVEREALEETARSIGDAALPVVTDVSSAADVDRLADRAFETHGEVHVLCNNAGVFQGGLAWERTVADWEWVLGVNLWGVIHGVRAFVPRMLRQGGEGHVVNTASLAGVVTGSLSGPYHVSKFGVVALSESLFHDLRTQGSEIGVSVLCPGAVATNIGSSERNRPAALEPGSGAEDAAFVTQMLVDITGRGAPPDEVAGMVVDAIRANRFYIPTTPDFDDQIRHRAEQFLKREAPHTLPFQ